MSYGSSITGGEMQDSRETTQESTSLDAPSVAQGSQETIITVPGTQDISDLKIEAQNIALDDQSLFVPHHERSAITFFDSPAVSAARAQSVPLMAESSSFLKPSRLETDIYSGQKNSPPPCVSHSMADVIKIPSTVPSQSTGTMQKRKRSRDCNLTSAKQFINPSRNTKPSQRQRPARPAKRQKAITRPARPAKRQKMSTRPAKTGKRQKTSKAVASNVLIDAAIAEGHDAPAEFDADTSRDRVLKQIMDALPQEKKRQAGSDRVNFVNASKALGRSSVKPDDGGTWSVNGMIAKLFSYQITGAGLGLLIERAGNGVILADVPGLGKTIQMLTAIAADRQRPKYKVRSTLIIVPPNLKEQWSEEINLHCTPIDPEDTGPGIGEVVYWSHNAMPSNNPCRYLAKADIVLATYHDVVESYKEKLAAEDVSKDGKASKASNGKRKSKSASAILHKTEFHRICIDEAHNIRDKNGKLSRACCALKSTRHWCLTGTPCTNWARDVHSLLSFGKHPIAENTPKRFRDALHEFPDTLEEVMIKRTNATEFFGTRLHSMPNLNHYEVSYSLRGLEGAIYKIVHNRFANYALGGKPRRGNRTLLAGLLMRPRQLVSHPMMLQHVIYDLMDTEGLAELLPKLVPEKYEDESDKTLASLFSHALAQYSGDEDIDSDFDEACVKCQGKDSGQEHYKTSCGHVYCKACLRGLTVIMGKKSCSECGDIIAKWDEIYRNIHMTDKDSTLLGAVARGRKLEYGNIADWIDHDGKIWRSAKVHKAVEVLKDIFRQRPGQKVILFTQWLGFEQILRHVCQVEEGWPCITYDGSMTAQSKNNAIHDFCEDPEKKILISSLMAGGIGLNLTVANNVILLDHWWNSAIEDQGFSRAYRIGQKHETHLYTLYAARTVEERMVKIKKKKVDDIGGLIVDEDLKKALAPIRDDEDTDMDSEEEEIEDKGVEDEDEEDKDDEDDEDEEDEEDEDDEEDDEE